MATNGSGKVSNCKRRVTFAKTTKKKYNTTGNTARIDRELERRIFRAIERVGHLTPASEVEMENCLRSDGSKIPVPPREQTIEENSPGYEPEIPEPEQERDKLDTQHDWMDSEGPTKAALQAIEAEAVA